ncbi:serine hydrolase domain-containing protein [Mycoplasma putrefaciens]|uniref:Beta-lactamase family protein n=1 Tax=Mycoplasma putrefaciens (strain ATCC 15718 / NCTC 10155 / C30 KS-1 / KS-1) TaxID=743965 RepID=A0A7U3ZS55_MYCPK|nr:serine hydrolase domain-containing protein [Mycoplasma putrefaciens]AEM68522.1 beta-lactamase family protein [Mycoplasma putrefaciens KS1]
MDFNKVEETINSFLQRNLFKGAVVRINKDKQTIYSKTFGYNDQNNQIPLKGNEIFRAYSMTKPLTAFAVLLLVDKKLISLDDDISKYIKSFKNKNITVWNLLTMTSGLTYSGNKTQTQIQTKEVLDRWMKERMDLETFCDELSKVDLLFEPKKGWYYGLSLDVACQIIEVVTNKKYCDFVKEEIFDKLEMFDSDFYLFDQARQANVFKWSLVDDQAKLEQLTNFNFLLQDVYKLPNCPMGGAGLFTTAADYIKFLDALLDGKYQQTEIISSQLLEQMRSDQLSKHNLKQFFKWNLNSDYSYGFGVRVRTKNNLYPLTEVGEFGWDGLLGSSGLVDPKNRITMTIMLSSFPGHNSVVESEFFDALYQDLRKNNLT